jgi:hypothetical protein
MTTRSKTDPADLAINPKTAPADDVPSNTVKDPDNWTTGGETMTDASKMIDALQAQTGRGRDH